MPFHQQGQYGQPGRGRNRGQGQNIYQSLGQQPQQPQSYGRAYPQGGQSYVSIADQMAMNAPPAPAAPATPAAPSPLGSPAPPPPAPPPPGMGGPGQAGYWANNNPYSSIPQTQLNTANQAAAAAAQAAQAAAAPVPPGAPPAPVAGTSYVDPATGNVYVYNNGMWNFIYTQGTGSPVTPPSGQHDM